MLRSAEEIAEAANGPTIQNVLKHYGYHDESMAPTVGLWSNNGTAIARLENLPEVLSLYKAEKRKIRVVFDYDPDYPKALLQIWGLQPATLSPDTDTHGGTLAT